MIILNVFTENYMLLSVLCTVPSVLFCQFIFNNQNGHVCRFIKNRDIKRAILFVCFAFALLGAPVQFHDFSSFRSSFPADLQRLLVERWPRTSGR